MSGDIVDLTEAIKDVFQMPCCSLCDQPIEEYEPYATYKAHGCIALAHIYCIAETRKEFKL